MVFTKLTKGGGKMVETLSCLNNGEYESTINNSIVDIDIETQVWPEYLKSKRNISVDSKLAEKILKFNNMKYQRPLNKRWVSELAEKMRTNKFHTSTIAICILDGVKYLLDGQHCCHALIESNAKKMFTYLTYEVENEEQLLSLFFQYGGGQPRTISNYAQNEVIRENLEWPIRFANMLISGAMLYKFGGSTFKYRPNRFENNYVEMETRSKLFREFFELNKLIAGIYLADNQKRMSPNIKHMNRTIIITVMYNTFQKSIKHSNLFWVRIRDGENLSSEMPEYKLREFLKTTKNLDNLTLYHKCASAWNASRQGRTPKYFKKINSETLPNFI